MKRDEKGNIKDFGQMKAKGCHPSGMDGGMGTRRPRVVRNDPGLMAGIPVLSLSTVVFLGCLLP